MLISPNILRDIKSDPTISSTASGGSDWSEHTADDGRIYYYNRVTKSSSWSKPDELKTPEEREKSVWKEYKTPDGKYYYYNTLTKVTTWSRPEVLNRDPKKEGKSNTPESRPELIHVTKNSEIEKAMEATLKTIKKDETEIMVKEPTKSEETEDDREYNLRKRQVEKFQELLQDKCNEKRISTNMNWEQASKYIRNDPRFQILGKVSEKKQVFNAWKTQRYKEERDEKRLAIKMAKEDLEKWLMDHPKMKPTLRYHKADTIFSSESQWRAVSESERREIFEDAKVAIVKRDADQKKALRERNIKALGDILEGIQEIDHKTTWAQAQRILIENPDFAKDTVLQSMDKEDALDVFQRHIKVTEEHYVQEKQLEAKRIKRQERKTREAFTQLLCELHERGTLRPNSTWTALYPTVSTDERFERMLLTNGSTALDLFKFYVEDLRNKYYDDKKLIKEILSTKEFVINETFSFANFQKLVLEDARGKQLDTINVKLCYNSLYDKAMEKQKESERELQKKQKRLESAFWEQLRSLAPPITPESDWDSVRERVRTMDQFEAVEDVGLRKQFFESYLKSIQETCGHYHGSSGTKKKKKEKKKKHASEKHTESEEKGKTKKKRKRSSPDGKEVEGRKKKKNKQKSRSSSISEGEVR